MSMTTAAMLIGLSVTTGCGARGEGAITSSGATALHRFARNPHISAATWTGGTWPFTVAEGDLGCINQGRMQIQTFTAGGITYSLNWAAKGTGRYPPVDAVWRADPKVPRAKVDIAEVMDKARSLCVG
jgi:hypothetical protein